MDRDVTPDQRVLLEASARFVEQTHPLSAVRTETHRDPHAAADYRRKAADLGWFSLLVPDSLGGGSLSGNGVLDAALVAYLRGQTLQPGGFVPTNVVAYALSAAGTEEQQAKVLPALLSGEQAATWVLGDTDVHGPRGITFDGAELTGESTFVIDGGTAHWLLITARSAAGPAQFLLPADTPGLTVVPLESMDISRRFAAVRLDRVAVGAGSQVGGPELVERQLALASVLTAAESTGAMDRDFAVALQYAKDRIAFGRPIGSFQAIKHQLADASLLLELCKAATLGAARSLGAAEAHSIEAASIAKALVGEHGVDVAQVCFQIFGGIGFTWEHDQHLYLRRLTTDASLFGDPAWHRERLCRLAGLEGAAS